MTGPQSQNSVSVLIRTHLDTVVVVDGWCPVHKRLLTYREFNADICFWCRPRMAPNDHKIRTLTEDELAKLVPAQVGVVVK